MLHSTKTKPRAPKFEIFLDHVHTSSSSSCDDSSQSVGSVSSISSLLNGKFGSAYKKRKIRQKVEAVMGSVESVCLEQGETLGDVVAQSCLFQRKKTFNGSFYCCFIRDVILDSWSAYSLFGAL